MPNNYILLETIALTQSAASVTFDNLPTSGYTDLKIVVSGRSDRNVFSFCYMRMRFNSTTTNYTYRILQGDGSNTSSLDQSNAGLFSDGILVGGTSQNNNTASTFSNTEVYIPNYRSSTNKSISSDGVTEANQANTLTIFTAGLWSNSAAITSISLEPWQGGTFNFLAGSTFSLYGVAALGTTPVLAPKATGGNIVANDGTYWYHAFTSSGYFVPQVGLTCDYLVVAGGGGGARYTPGGAGAGGLRSTVTATGGGGALESPISVTSGTNYAIVVGAGGAGATTNTTPGVKGNDSVFSTITSTGGGFAFNENGAPGTGGSGGGGSRTFTTGAAASPSGQGYAGGNSTATPAWGGGGGGGAGAVGGNGTGSTAGNGGAGVSIPSFASATNTGVSNFYAGGGGGAAYNTAGSTGGSGGGGNGTVSPTAPGSGIANTGGGGGSVAADGSGNVTQNGGSGGSGIVIIRYPIA